MKRKTETKAKSASAHPRREETPAKSKKKSPSVQLSPSRKQTEEPKRLLPEKCPDSEVTRITFYYFNSNAQRVQLAGSFNDWRPEATALVDLGDGRWGIELNLKPGRYEYRYVIDGIWQDDPLAARFVANPFGGLNCVLEVSVEETAEE